jgi:hypothetical protein
MSNYLDIAKRLERNEISLEYARTEALTIAKNPKIVRDLKRKRNVNEMLWVLTQLALKSEGLGVIA